MITNTPFLRLHVESEDQTVDPTAEFVASVPGLNQLVKSFSAATGWEIGMQPSTPSTGFFPSDYLSNCGTTAPFDLKVVDMSADIPPGEKCLHREQCDGVIASINQMLVDLCRSRRAVNQLNAELSTTIPVTFQDQNLRKKHSQQLLNRLEGVLLQGVEALGMTASGVYLLDDATQELDLRIHTGLSPDRLLLPPRLLSECVADLDALTGQTVLINDSLLLPDWNIPESYPSSICVPVATHSTPLGTVWFFSEKKREFSKQDSLIAELIGGRVAAELERESASRVGSVSRKLERDIDRARVWQQIQTPPSLPQIDGWAVTGKDFLTDEIGGAFHDLSVSPSGLIVASIGDVQGAMIESGLAASSLRGAMRAHQAYLPIPKKFLFDINNTMWDCPLGDQIGSVFNVQIEPETGIASWANAGQTGALILGAAAETDITAEGSPLGACEDEEFEARDRVLLPSSVLFAFNDGFRQIFRMAFRRSDDFSIMEIMSGEELRTATAISDWVSKLVENHDSHRRIPDISFIAIERTTET